MTKRTHAVYHFWFDGRGALPASENRTVPILASIATLRAVSQMPILVIDLTDDSPSDRWGDLPKKLGFQVVRAAPTFTREESSHWRFLSRFLDVRDVVARIAPDCGTVMYVDTDVFWLRDPEPFQRDPSRLCTNRWNAGYFYFALGAARPFFAAYERNARRAIASASFRDEVRKKLGQGPEQPVHDEALMKWMAGNEPALFDFLSPEEHCLLYDGYEDVDVDKMKMFHANSLTVRNPLAEDAHESQFCRGLLGLVVEEFYWAMRSVLPKADFEHYYSPREIAHYLPLQFSLRRQRAALLASKVGHYEWDLQKCLRAHSLPNWPPPESLSLAARIRRRLRRALR